MANPASSTPGIKFPWWALLPLAAAFGLAIWQMRFDWIYDESYYYGWSVLPLALYLFSLRWRDRPAPGPPLPPAILNTGWALLSLLYPLTWPGFIEKSAASILIPANACPATSSPRLAVLAVLADTKSHSRRAGAQRSQGTFYTGHLIDRTRSRRWVANQIHYLGKGR